MYAKSARFYDALYHFKDYSAACERLHRLIRGLNPRAESLLDVGCGTGRHLEHLRRWYRAEGLDINPELLAIAAERSPGLPVHEASMLDFSLGRKFDVVTCLFSSIGAMRTEAELQAAVANMAAHLGEGGVLVIEPWFTPERFWTGRTTANFVDEPDLKIAWMYRTEVEDGVSIADVHYLVGTPEGVEHFTERLEAGLFTDAQYRAAIEATGLAVRFDEQGLFDRGLYVGHDPSLAGVELEA